MANYYCSARSNYFKVRDLKAFKEWVDHIGQGLTVSPKHPEGYDARAHRLRRLTTQLEDQGGRGVDLAEEIDQLRQQKEKEDNLPDQLLCLLCENADGGGWPCMIEDQETEEFIDFDFTAELADHLQKEEVAIIMEAGAEKLRYLTGFATAINHEGDILQVSISDIYKLVQEEWHITPTPAEY